VKRERPLLRGWLHLTAIGPAFAGAITLIALAHNDPVKVVTLTVYGVGLTLLFTVSALYHLVPWSAAARDRWRRADRVTIFLMIAATYTPITAALLDGWTRTALLAAVWTLALAGGLVVGADLPVPRPALVTLYVVVGWTALVAMPAFFARTGPAGIAFIGAGGALYSAGALVYASRRPQLWPDVFGYHEAFHLLVLAATAVFFAFIANRVVLTAG
jgi:hemolysin III